MKSPKSRIEMFLRNPIRYIHAWWALKTVQWDETFKEYTTQYTKIIGEYADNIRSQVDYAHSEISEEMTEDKREEKTGETFETLNDVLDDITWHVVEWAEHRTSVYPDGRQYIEIWTYPPTVDEKEDD